MKIQRFRKFNTREVYPGGRHDNGMCMAVKAGNRIYLRGRPDSTWTRGFATPAIRRPRPTRR